MQQYRNPRPQRGDDFEGTGPADWFASRDVGSYQTDPMKSTLEGGVLARAGQQADRLGARSEQVQGRGGVQIDQRGSNAAYGQTQRDYDRTQQAYSLDEQARALGMQSRGAQQQAISGLQSYLRKGPGPSAAQAQLASGQDANMAQALALANSGRGTGGAASMRDAMMQNAKTGQQTNQQASVLRAQEASDWRNQQLQGQQAVMQGYGAMRGADAGIRSQDQSLMGLGQSQQQLGQSQQNIFNQSAQAQAGMTMRQRELNDQYSLGLGGQSLGYDQLRQQGYTDEMRARLGQEAIDAQGYNAAELAMAEGDARNDESATGLFSSAMGALGGVLSDVRAKENIKSTAMDEVFKALGGKAYAGYQLGQKLRGDGNSDGAAAQAMRPVKGYSYDYKNPKGPEQQGRQFGVMAQDLEKTPAGAAVVSQNRNGQKVIDANKLTTLNTAAIAEQQRKLDELQRQRWGNQSPPDARMQEEYAALRGRY